MLRNRKIRTIVIFGPSQNKTKILRPGRRPLKLQQQKDKDPHYIHLLQILHRVFFLSPPPPSKAVFSHGKHGSAGISCDSCGLDGGYERNAL
jgi:hypothetical protein